MARPTLPTQFDVDPQYYGLVKDPGGNVMGQVRSINPNLSLETSQAGRVGSSTKKTLKKSKNGTLALIIWTDRDLAEVAVALNRSSAPASSDTVQLDPDASPTNLTIERYTGEAASATLVDTWYIRQYAATEMSFTFDEDGEQVVNISGTLEDLYAVRA